MIGLSSSSGIAAYTSLQSQSVGIERTKVRAQSSAEAAEKRSDRDVQPSGVDGSVETNSGAFNVKSFDQANLDPNAPRGSYVNVVV